MGVERVEQSVEEAQRFVDEQADRPQRAIDRHEVFEHDHHEQRFLQPVRSARRIDLALL